MKIISPLFVTLLFNILMFAGLASAQQGTVIFDVNAMPKGPEVKNNTQSVMFLGCGVNPVHNFEWNTQNQSRSLPYLVKDKRCPNGECYASKYYMASPPLYTDKQAILGQLMPDRFSWQTTNKQQNVVMDYAVLQPVSLREIHAVFDDSCEQQNVSLVPINIECKNLPGIQHTIPASGIGFLKSKDDVSKIFIPLLGTDPQSAAECSATILNDIVLGNRIYFDDKGAQRTSISMTELYNNNQKMTFVCEQRPKGEVPTGCLPIEQ